MMHRSSVVSVVPCLLLLLSAPWTTAQKPDEAACAAEDVNFELVTGYLYSTPADMLDSRIGTLLLSDCVDTCRQNDTCKGFNYETGLCVLIDSTADEDPGSLTESQFPVFTMYLQKMCYTGAPKCGNAWAFERVMNYTLEGHEKKTVEAQSRVDCERACLKEEEFVCRSASFSSEKGECQLSDMDRHTTAGMGSFKASEGVDYLENNCVEEPVRLCEFRQITDRILKTVDSVHQEIESDEDCRKLCMDADFRCHTYDYDEVADQVCRLSHHAVATLTHVEDPYLEIPNATSYELSSCYNVTIDCRSGDMTARIKTSKVFGGKVYAKSSPNSCVTDVGGALEFELTMSYNDIECDVKREGPGRYHNDIVLQHHDRIVTAADLGLRVHCQYDLSNKSVSNAVDLEVQGDIKPVLEEEAVVDSPNVLMRITDRDGSEMQAASVGDPLSLRFQIMDPQSPYEIFVRELVAQDGSNINEIMLIDERGCPTDEAIMGALLKVNETKLLAAAFDAFKFPTSDVVQFRALVTPCLPKCEPVNCEVRDYVGNVRDTPSYGRRRRSTSALERTKRSADDEELLVVQTIRINDKFVERKDELLDSEDREQVLVSDPFGNGTCVNTMGLVIGGALFLLAQVILIAAWMYAYQRRRRNKMIDDFPETTTNSLAQLYDTGYTTRRA